MEEIENLMVRDDWWDSNTRHVTKDEDYYNNMPDYLDEEE